MKHPRTLRRRREAVAAVEFAVALPFLAFLLAGAADFGFAMWTRSCLTNAIAQGAYYAFRTGSNVSTASVQTIVQSAASVAGVAVQGIASAPSCYCPSGTTAPATLGSAVTCGSTCGDGSAAGIYLAITATYHFSSFLPANSPYGLGARTFTDTVTVRLQ